MVKVWTKTDPKDSKILALTTILSKLDLRKLLYLQQFNEEEEPKPDPKQHKSKGTQQ